MISLKKSKLVFLPLLAVIAGCTKLDEKLQSTLTKDQVQGLKGSTDLLLAAAYADLAAPLHSQDRVFSLQENTTDESLVPTRGGDWDDNGAWRVMHNHTWDADNDQVLQTFNLLNKINFDATNVLDFKPPAAQAAEARYLRALSLYLLVDLYGQYPFREPGENLLNTPPVKAGTEAIDFVISELTAIIPDLDSKSKPERANPDAAKVLLMKCYLQKGVISKRDNPAFDPADMDKVIALGNEIINSGKYSYSTDYFDNFSVTNGTSKEAIFTYPNTSGIATNHGAIEARWNMTLHYNSFTPNNPNAGWNGFSTISEFYSSFGANGATIKFGPDDTLLDKRLGGRYYVGSTDISGIRPGFLVGQQYDENGVARKDRKGNPLAYTPDIAADMKETGPDLEIKGIRVVKYVPDFSDPDKPYNKYYGGPAGNDLMIFRYPDVVLMVAEAKKRRGDDAGALTMVNDLRVARGAAALASMVLANPTNVDDPNTLLAERGRELYWESFRRSDLQRFGVYLIPWGLKPTDDPKYLLFPVPNQALAANPNLKQNTGYN